MENQRNHLLPETNDASPQMYYDDLKDPLTRRGIPIPKAMEDYIHSLTARDMLSDEDIKAIYAEMVKMFEDAEQQRPFDFEDNFEKWFPRGGQATDTDQNNTPERESSVESSDTDPVQGSVNPVQSSVAENQHNSSPNTSGRRAPRFPEIPNNPVPYLHPELSAKEKFCEYLQQINAEHTAATGEIRSALGLAKSTFKWVVDQLIAEGKVEQIGYGLYRLKRSV